MKSLSDARDSMHQLLDQMFDAFDEVPPQGTTRSSGDGGVGKGDGGVRGEEDRKKSNNKHNSGNNSNNSTIKVGHLMI